MNFMKPASAKLKRFTLMWTLLAAIILLIAYVVPEPLLLWFVSFAGAIVLGAILWLVLERIFP